MWTRAQTELSGFGSAAKHSTSASTSAAASSAATAQIYTPSGKLESSASSQSHNLSGTSLRGLGHEQESLEELSQDSAKHKQSNLTAAGLSTIPECKSYGSLAMFGGNSRRDEGNASEDGEMGEFPHHHPHNWDLTHAVHSQSHSQSLFAEASYGGSALKAGGRSESW